MSNIFGEKLDDNIQRQIEIRQKIYGSGYAAGVSRSSDISLYLNGNTSWCKLVSGVNKDNSNELAKKYKLFNGTALADTTNLRGGITSANVIDSNNAYGIGGNEFGINPMMGITSATINYENRGSIRKANIKIKAFNKNQFDIIDTLYLRLGFTMLLEWGHSLYFLKDINNNEALLNTLTTLDDKFLKGDLTYTQFLLLIESYKIDIYQGNYDAMIGRVVNFDYSFNKDGSYDINIILISLGDVIESLRCNSYIPSATSLEVDQITQDLNSLSALTVRLYESTNTIAAFLAKGVPQILTKEALQIKSSQPITPIPDLNIFQTGPSAATGTSAGATAVTNIVDIDLISNYEELKEKGDLLLKDVINKSIAENQKKFAISLTNANNRSSLLTDNDLSYLNNTIGFKKIFRSSETFKNQTPITNSTPFIVVEYTSDIGTQYYVKLGEFLSFLQEGDGEGKGFIIPKVYLKGKEKGESIIKFDVTPVNNLMYVDPVQICTDPRVCFTRRKISINKTPVEFVDKFGIANEFIFQDSKASIMDIYINSAFIIDTIKSNTDNSGKLSIFDLLKIILNSVSKSLGGLNKLDIFVDESTNRALIIDKNPYPYKKYQPTIFKILGYDNDGTSFVKNFNLKTELPSSLSTMVVVGAQQNGVVVGENATALSRLNNQTKDRYQYKISNTNALPIEEMDGFKKAFFTSEAWGRYKNFLLKLSNLTATTSDTDSFSGQLKDLFTIVTSINEQTNPPKTCAVFTGFIPFNLSLDIDGLSGMKINQTILVDTDYLPKNYPKYVNFLIKNIQHTIENNKWTTKLESFTISSTSEVDVQEETLSSEYLNSIEVDSNYESYSIKLAKKLFEQGDLKRALDPTKAPSTNNIDEIIKWAKKQINDNKTVVIPNNDKTIPSSGIYLNTWTKEIETPTLDRPAGNWIVDGVDVWDAVGGARGTGDITNGWSGFLNKSSKQPRNGGGRTLDVNVYKAWKNNNKIYWSVWDLDKGQPVAQSANANENVYGASVSKAVVAAHYFDKFSNNGVLPNTKDYWYVVTALIPSNNNSWKTLQDKIDPNRLLTNSWSKSKGYNNMEPAIRPNKINAVGMNKFWDDISKNKLKGSGVIAKSCLAGSTHRNRSQLYIPSEYYVGTKTGSYLTYNHDSGFVGKIGGKWFAITVLTSGGGNPAVAALWGGLFREYYLKDINFQIG